MFEKQINKLKNKLDEQEKILELKEPINNPNIIMLFEKEIMFFSLVITLFSLSIALIEFSNFRSPNTLEANKEHKYIQLTNTQEKLMDFNQLYGKLNSSKKTIHIIFNDKINSYDMNNLSINLYSEKIENLSEEIIRLKTTIIDIQNQKKEILLENEILTTKNILLDKESKYNIAKLEEKLMALSSKTKIQNQKLFTAINMIDNLKLERVNLLSKLNLPINHESQLANYK